MAKRRDLSSRLPKLAGRFDNAPIDSTGPLGAKGPRPISKEVVEPRRVPHMPTAGATRPQMLKIVQKRGVRKA